MTIIKTSLGRATASVAVAAGLLLAVTGNASAYSDRVKSSCRGDYHQFCPQYSIGSTALRQCMRSAGKNISLACRRALVAEGELPAKYAR